MQDDKSTLASLLGVATPPAPGLESSEGPDRIKGGPTTTPPPAAGLESFNEHGSVKGGPAVTPSPPTRIVKGDYVLILAGESPSGTLSAGKYGVVILIDPFDRNSDKPFIVSERHASSMITLVSNF